MKRSMWRRSLPLLLGAQALVLPRSPARQASSYQLRAPAWQTYHDGDGTPYYYDTESGETSWTAPPGMAAAARATADDGADSAQPWTDFSQPDAEPSSPFQRSTKAVRSQADGAAKRQERYKEACDQAKARGEPVPNYAAFMTALSASDSAPQFESAAPAAPPAVPPVAVAMSAEEEQELEDWKRTQAAKARALNRMEAAVQSGGPIPSSHAADDYMSALEA